jgi:hypothetical protein
MQDQKFSIHALVELMGHQRIAGLVTEEVVAGHGFLRIDVPETSSNPAFTRLVSPNSVYAINPITEEVAKQYAESLSVKPINTWDIHEFIEKATQKRLSTTTHHEQD